VRQLTVTPLRLDVNVEIRHSDPEQTATISIEDKLSGIHFVEVELAWEDLARLVLTNVHARPGTAELRTSSDIGKRRENSEVTIDVEGLMGLRDDVTFSNLVRLRFMADYPALHAAGWRPMYHATKGYNGHLRTGAGKYRIAIERWVEA
jgi:hypothetical protein